MTAVVRVDRHPGFILRLPATLQIRIGQVEAVLVHLHIGAELDRTTVRASGAAARA
jgi:hypothetical protein